MEDKKTEEAAETLKPEDDEQLQRSPQGRMSGKVKIKKGHRRAHSDARKEFKIQNTIFMCTELAKFVSEILDKPVDANFIVSLKRGTELCDLLEKVTKGQNKCKRIVRSRGISAMNIAGYRNNVHKFQTGCRQAGIQETDLLDYSCFEKEGTIEELAVHGHIDPILNNLYALLGIAHRNGIKIPETLLSKVKEKKISEGTPGPAEAKDEPDNLFDGECEGEGEGETKKSGDTKDATVETDTKEINDDNLTEGSLDIDSEEPITIYVNLPGHLAMEVQVKPTEKIQKIKDIIEKKTSIACWKQTLFHGSTEDKLNPNSTVAASHLDGGMSIDVKVYKGYISIPLSASVNAAVLIAALLLLLIAFFYDVWAIEMNMNGNYEYGFGLSGYYNAKNDYAGYSNGNGWDRINSHLRNSGFWISALIITGVICMLLSIADMICKATGMDYPEMNSRKSTCWKVTSSWILDHLFVFPIISTCAIFGVIVLYSYAVSPSAFSLGRFLAETPKIIFTYGPSFYCTVSACVLLFVAAIAVHLLRYERIVQRLEKSSSSEKKVSTYGSIEIVLEPTTFKTATMC